MLVLWFAEVNMIRILMGALFAVGLPLGVSAADSRPNILVVLCDDLGYGDLGCYGNDVIRSPNIDKFAADGMRFTDCYAASANCSPARTGLMTGRTPYRVGIHNWIPMNSPMHVSSREITVATLLQKSGYATCHVGKWHLNGRFNLTGQPQPDDHGFGHWFSTQNNCLPDHRFPWNFVRNGQPVGTIEDYASHLVTDEAIHWLSELRDKSKPFFIYCCYHEPHEPIASAKKYRELYPSDDPSYSRHHGNITQMDEAFGRLLASLSEQGLRENTLIFFTSDNGPAITAQHPHGSAGPLRDKKGSVYEGGIRVPGIMQWPGFVRPGSVSHEPICGVDILPTLCEIAGADVPEDRKIDGASIVPVLAGKPIARTTPLYWQFNRAHSDVKVALRVGEWKLLATLTGTNWKPGGEIRLEDERVMKAAELDRFELYNLQADLGEQTNLVETEPAKLAELKSLLEPMYREVRDESPIWPDWEFDRVEGEAIRTGKQARREAGWDDY
jgi:arylsulfatase A